MTILKFLQQSSRENKKLIAVLIDPDRIGDKKSTHDFLALCESSGVDLYLIGGSLLTTTRLSELVGWVKSFTTRPVIRFPGSQLNFDARADGILFLSLISGRNADLLIGKHVEAAPFIKKTGMEVIPTGYMLVGDKANTTAAYISQTLPIPLAKSEIAACTALAGEMLGLQLIYIDAGSGAETVVSPSMVHEVKKAIKIPLIVGGGINSAEKVTAAWRAGADIIVIGTAIERTPGFIEEVTKARDILNNT